jgi:hypothetical protein
MATMIVLNDISTWQLGIHAHLGLARRRDDVPAPDPVDERHLPLGGAQGR